ncbi:hypothetical protein ACET3Z_012637 [Daucus carota]
MLAYCHKPRISFLKTIKNHLTLFQFYTSRTLAVLSTADDKTPKNEPKYHDFTVNYLKKTLGLSPEIANSTSLKVKFGSLHGPDSVVALLRAHGFDRTQLSRIITRVPKLLVVNADEIMEPKLKFFASVGITNESMMLSEKQIGSISRYFSWASASKLQHCVAPNVKLLKEIGVSQKHISFLICRNSRIVGLGTHKFKELVEEVVALKFDPSKGVFVRALAIMFARTKLVWEQKVEIYKRWGWSEQDVLSAFRSDPHCMSKSEKKIMSVMDFLVNKMGFQSTAIARSPVVLSLSLELRIIPRCSVFSVLRMKGLISEDLSSFALTFLVLTDNEFVDKFITKYQEQLPQLLSVYKDMQKQK